MKGLPLESETWDKSGELTQVVVVQSLSRVLLFVTPWTAARQASLSFTISQSLLRLTSTEYDAIQLSHLRLPSSPFAFNLSQHQGLFQWVDSLHQVAKVLELLWTEGPGGLQSMELQRMRRNWMTNTSNSKYREACILLTLYIFSP